MGRKGHMAISGIRALALFLGSHGSKEAGDSGTRWCMPRTYPLYNPRKGTESAYIRDIRASLSAADHLLSLLLQQFRKRPYSQPDCWRVFLPADDVRLLLFRTQTFYSPLSI